MLPQLLLEEEHLGPYGVYAEVWGTLFRRPAKLEPGQRQVPAEPVMFLLPGGEQTLRFPLHRQRPVLRVCSPSARLFHPGAQQEVGVQEEVAKAALSLAHVHHEAVAHQPVVLQRHRQNLRLFGTEKSDSTRVPATRLTMRRLSVTSRLLCELSFTPVRKLRDSLRASCRAAWSPCAAGVVFRTS